MTKKNRETVIPAAAALSMMGAKVAEANRGALPDADASLREDLTVKALYLEDLAVGDVWEGGPVTLTEADIVSFAEAFDPQPMHVDPAAASQGRFGGVIASGWHVAALVMRDFVDRKPFGDTPLLGLSVDQLNWLQPVRPGDILRIRREIVAVARSRSKPDRGTVQMKMTVTNQCDEVVMSFLNLIQVPAARPAEMS